MTDGSHGPMPVPAPRAPTGEAPERAGMVLVSLIAVAAVANLNLSVANVALPSIGSDLGVLTLYPEATDDQNLDSIAESAGLLAATVAALLHDADVRAELQALAGQLETARQSRATIDQAKGIIMAAQGCVPDEAFQVLAKASSTTNVKLRELARQLVEQVTDKGVIPGL